MEGGVRDTVAIEKWGKERECEREGNEGRKGRVRGEGEIARRV